MKNTRIVIVGGVAGGASAAAKARRVDEHAEITVFERGPYISFANCGLPYFIGGDIADRTSLVVMTPEAFATKYRVDAQVRHEVTRIDRAARTVTVRNAAGEEREVGYDKLVLSQGAQPIVPPFPGVDQPHIFTLRDIPDMDRIVKYLEENKPRRAVVIGGGFIGLEMAEAFHRRGMHVAVVEKAPHILPLLDDDVAREFQEKLSQEDFAFYPGMGAKEFTDRAVVLEDGRELPADLVLLSVGVKPEVILAKEAGLEIGASGGVRTNAFMQSSDPAIYAVGDAAETTHFLTGTRVRVPLAGPANRQGRVAGANAAGRRMRYGGVMGTSIVRVRHLTAGFTGLNSRQAREAGLTWFASMTRDWSHASYYPGAKQLVTKLIVEEGTGRLLGAQVIGEERVDKRVDVFATAIAARMSVLDLEDLDLAYSPPFGSANDPVNVAAQVAANILRGDVETVSPEPPLPSDAQLLDVRDPSEIEQSGKLDGSINIPLGELRDRLAELDPERPVVAYCQKGQRGYLATCILRGRGFNQVKNLRGGYLQARLNLPSSSLSRSIDARSKH